IVRAHRGCITVTSAPGRGTTVRLAFPVGSRPLTRPAVPPESGSHGRAHGTILLMDDEQVVREIASLMIERLGYTVLTATNGKEGLELLDRHRDEIVGVMLDLTMPVMDGAEAYRQIRRRDAKLPVILSSGYAEEEATKDFTDNGLLGFIQKPYTMEQVTKVLQRLP
ncbi:MAG: response regulator, partial [Thermodesulfobacteriota bacterium]